MKLRWFLHPIQTLRNYLRRKHRIEIYNLGYNLLGSQDGYPLPPADLVDLVIGTREIGWYQFGGLFAHQSFTTFLRRNNIEFKDTRSIFDFGCGCGRIIRWFNDWKATSEIWGTDYNPALIHWCQKNLADIARFKVNQPNPPLDFEDNKFELVYSYSVFTHLARDIQIPWLKELTRVTRPGGHLLITTHGQRVAWRLGFSPEQFDQLEREGIMIFNEELSGQNSCTVFHSENFWKNQQALGLELVDFMGGGVRDSSEQDMYLFRKVA